MDDETKKLIIKAILTGLICGLGSGLLIQF